MKRTLLEAMRDVFVIVSWLMLMVAFAWMIAALPAVPG